MLALIFAWLLRAVLTDPAPVEVDPIPVDPFEPGTPGFDPRLDTAPPWLPDVKATDQFTGTGSQPTWDDVYKYAETKFDTDFAAGRNVTNDATAAFILNTGRAAIGESIRAISGFINQGITLMQSEFTDLYSTLQFVLGGLDQTNTDQYNKIQKLQQEVNGLSTIVAAEEAQIVQLHDLIFQAVEFEGAYIQDWARRTILDPLYTEIVSIGPETDRKILLSDQNVLQQAHTDTLTQLAPVVAVATALATKVAALTAESETCVQPMCSTLGPNTPLGKLLNALSLIADAAALADLLGLTAPELAARIGDAIRLITGYVGDFETYFTDGTETIGSVLSSIGANIL